MSDTTLGTVRDHLDEMDKRTRWALALALLEGLVAMQGTSTIGLLGLEVSRLQAYWLMWGVLVLYIAEVWLRIELIGEILEGVDAEELPPATAVIGAHHWLLNPLAPKRQMHGIWSLAVIRRLRGLPAMLATFTVCMLCVFVLLPPAAFEAPALLWLRGESLDRVIYPLAVLIPSVVFLSLVFVVVFAVRRVLQEMGRSLDAAEAEAWLDRYDREWLMWGSACLVLYVVAGGVIAFTAGAR